MPELPKFPAEMPVQPVGRAVDLDLAVPGSKSITNRALIIGALAEGELTLTDALFADDTGHMVKALQALGFRVELWPEAKRIAIQGLGGRIPASGADLFLGNAGTAMRFLTALVSLGEGRFVLDGTSRMRERPIGDLVDGLRVLGLDINYMGQEGCPPVVLHSRGGLPGGRCQVDGGRSSQYISAILMVAPYARSVLELEVVGEFVSRPYAELTIRTMDDLGVLTSTDGARIFRPTHGKHYLPGEYAIEGDASSASYFLAAAAILGGRVAVTNLRADSPQGDIGLAQVLARMGCQVRWGFLAGNRGIEVSRDPGRPLRPINVSLNDMPDMAQTLAVVCLFAEGTSSIVDVGNLRIKETDRLKALAVELTRLGATVVEGPDYIEITPGQPQGARIETYDDHRMAMAFSLVGLGRPGVSLRNPACVTKTYPGFFADLEKLRA